MRDRARRGRAAVPCCASRPRSKSAFPPEVASSLRSRLIPPKLGPRRKWRGFCLAHAQQPKLVIADGRVTMLAGLGFDPIGRNRREASSDRASRFIAGAATAVAAPFVLRQARAANLRIRRDVQSMAPNDPWFTKYGRPSRRCTTCKSRCRKISATGAIRPSSISIIARTARHSFVHWHRHYILNYENICAELIGDPNFALAYGMGGEVRIDPEPVLRSPAAERDVLEGPVQRAVEQLGPGHGDDVRNARAGKRKGLQSDPNSGRRLHPGAHRRHQGTDELLYFHKPAGNGPAQQRAYDHRRVNGHMGNGMSPLDPIFWLHHCNIDRIWAEWQSTGNTTPPSIATTTINS